MLHCLSSLMPTLLSFVTKLITIVTFHGVTIYSSVSMKITPPTSYKVIGSSWASFIMTLTLQCSMTKFITRKAIAIQRVFIPFLLIPPGWCAIHRWIFTWGAFLLMFHLCVSQNMFLICSFVFSLCGGRTCIIFPLWWCIPSKWVLAWGSFLLIFISSNFPSKFLIYSFKQSVDCWCWLLVWSQVIFA